VNSSGRPIDGRTPEESNSNAHQDGHHEYVRASVAATNSTSSIAFSRRDEPKGAKGLREENDEGTFACVSSLCYFEVQTRLRACMLTERELGLPPQTPSTPSLNTIQPATPRRHTRPRLRTQTFISSALPNNHIGLE